MTAHGVLRWNVLTRFRAYVSSIEDGVQQWAGDRGRLTGEFAEFELASALFGDAQDVKGLRFAGAVRFSAYDGMLMVHLADPWLEIGLGTANLSVDPSSPSVSRPRATIATVQHVPVPPGTQEGVAWVDRPARLTDAGAALLGGVYPDGTECDPVTVLVSPDQLRRARPRLQP